MMFGGVDPGHEGAIAVYDSTLRRVVVMISIPVFDIGKAGGGSNRQINVHALKSELEWNIISAGIKIDKMFIEHVQSQPNEGAVGAFKFGRGYGQVEAAMIFCGWPTEYVTPQVWKKKHGIASGSPKDASLSKANQIMPADSELWTPRRLVLTKALAYGRAEAALIARYGELISNAPVVKPRRKRETLD